jgi:cyclin B/cyclin A
MMEVLYSFKCEIETIFLAVQIFDKFLYTVTCPTLKPQLHLIGTTALYIASKMEDITPISVNNLLNKILHNEYEA